MSENLERRSFLLGWLATPFAGLLGSTPAQPAAASPPPAPPCLDPEFSTATLWSSSPALAQSVEIVDELPTDHDYCFAALIDDEATGRPRYEVYR